MKLNYDKEVSDAHLAAAGWDLGAFYHSNPFESHIFYVHDYRHGHTRLFTIKQDEFDAMRQSANHPIEMMVGYIAHTMAQFAQGQHDIAGDAALTHALVGYTKSTKTYRQWRLIAGGQGRLHMLINIYPERGNEGLLRPFIMNTPNTVLTSEEVLHNSEKVREIDRLNHPEWFKTKKLGGRR